MLIRTRASARTQCFVVCVLACVNSVFSKFSVLLCGRSVLRALTCARAADPEKYSRNSNSELVEVYFAC